MQFTLKSLAIICLFIIIFLMLLRELMIKYVNKWYKELNAHYYFLLNRFFKQLD